MVKCRSLKFIGKDNEFQIVHYINIVFQTASSLVRNWNSKVKCRSLKFIGEDNEFQIVHYIDFDFQSNSFIGLTHKFEGEYLEFMNVSSLEIMRFELMASCLQGRRSPSWAIPPGTKIFDFCNWEWRIESWELKSKNFIFLFTFAFDLNSQRSILNSQLVCRWHTRWA